MDNKLEILLQLAKDRGHEYTMHELSLALHIPYASFYRVIKKMQDLLVTKTVGAATLLKLNIKNEVVTSYLAIASYEEKKLFLQKQPLINLLVKQFDTQDVIVLFGSYAKGTATKRSDIDLLVINADGKKSMSFTKYELIYKIPINPIFITVLEFEQMLRAPEENVGKQALKHNIVLNNAQRFWDLTIK